MNSALTLLKQEINQTMEAEHDLAKWKLGVTAALGAAAFGLAQNNPKHWLLLFVPFVCAYIDLYAYQCQFRIRVIAGFLRDHAEGDTVLQRYEQECEELRGEHFFSLGNWAGIGCSLGVCVSGPVLYYLQHRPPGVDYLQVPFARAATIWLLGVLLIVFLWVYFEVMAGKIPKKGKRGGPARAG
jgi:hypothetical protein